MTAALSGYLGAGHLDTTTEPDLLVWAVIVWLLVKLLAGGDRRLWLAVGVTTGIGLENKDTLLFLGAGLAVGLVLARRWDVVRSPWAWAAVGIALLIWAPNLAWQATNGWPQLTMAHAIAGYAADNRAQVLPLLWLFTGPLLFPVSVAGWSGCSSRRRPRRGERSGSPPWSRWLSSSSAAARPTTRSAACRSSWRPARSSSTAGWRGATRLKATAFATAAVLSGALIALLTLPILPVADYAKSGSRGGPDTANQIGWPQFVSTVEQVVAALPAEQRAHAVILTNNYSEASPLVLLGTGLPPVYSGHNGYWYWGPPPADRTVVVHVGDWRPADWSQFFADCRDVAHIDNGLGIDNGEQGKTVSVCTGLRAPWTEMWADLRTIS